MDVGRVQKVAVAVLGIVLVLQAGRIAEAKRSYSLLPSEIEVGMPLSDVELHEEGESTTSSSGLKSVSDAFPDQCGLMVFFFSGCPYCEQLGARWSGKEKIIYDGLPLPVAWISVAADDGGRGARAFVDRFELPTPWFRLPSVKEQYAIGVDRVPLIYLLSPGGVFERTMPRSEVEPIELPESCVAK